MADKPIREQSALELLETHAKALEADRDRLRAALEGAVDVIKTWHNMSRIGLRGDPTLEAVWDIYWRCAPEMRPIREALAAVETTARCPVTWQPVIGGPAVPCTLPVGHNGKHLAPEPFAAKTEGSQT